MTKDEKDLVNIIEGVAVLAAAYGNHQASAVLYALASAICHGEQATMRLADSTLDSMGKSIESSRPEWN